MFVHDMSLEPTTDVQVTCKTISMNITYINPNTEDKPGLVPKHITIKASLCNLREIIREFLVYVTMKSLSCLLYIC